MKTISLRANFEHGEGSIHVTDYFSQQSWLLKADLLKDWIYDLEREYEKALLEWEHENFEW